MTERPAPFTAPPYRAGRFDLSRIGPEAPAMAAAIAEMDPWKRLGIPAAALTVALTPQDTGTHAFLLSSEGVSCGAAVIRYPFLRGPYLELLAILPGHQRQGLGRAVIAFMDHETRGRANNLWVCVSEGNATALRLYENCGFRKVADLPDLVRPGFAELLMRKLVG